LKTQNSQYFYWVKVALAVSFVLLSWTNVLGLSLGRINLDSSLNEALSATIKLDKVQDWTAQDFRVRLASKKTFDDFGVAWTQNLTQLSLKVASIESETRIELSSKGPVTEPYLNFVVEVLWPNGRIVREYTVLLDPPLLLDRSKRLAIAPVQSTRPQFEIAKTDGSSDFKKGTVTRAGDTLWAIALKTRPDQSISVQTMMLAIQDRNPNAFYGQNINQLKAGYTLVMPSESELIGIPAQTAAAEVASQNRVLESVASSPIQPQDTVLESELVLVGIEDPNPNPDADGDSYPDLAELEPGAAEEISTATGVEQELFRDRLESVKSERDALSDRLVSLEIKFDALTQTILVKDDALSALESKLRSLDATRQTIPEPEALTPVSIALMIAIVVLVAILLLMSARYQRLTRSLRSSAANAVGADLNRMGPSSDLSRSHETVNEQPLRAVEKNQEGDSSVQSTKVAAPDNLDDECEDSSRSVSDRFSSEGIKQTGLSEAVPLAEVSQPEPVLDLDLSEFEELGELDELVLAEISDEAPEIEPGPDENPANMMDLARAYVDMGDADAARGLLNRVAVIGTASEAAEAQKMLVTLSED
jgi:FimV-like protein